MPATPPGHWKDLEPALGYGVGLRWRSPVGPLRLDLAYGEEVQALPRPPERGHRVLKPMGDTAATPPKKPIGRATPPPRGRGWRVLRWFALALVAVCVAAAFALHWAVRSEAGSAWVLGHLPGVQVGGVRGTLLGDLDVGRLQVGLPGDGKLDVTGLAWRGLRLEPVEGRAWFRVVADRLSATRIDVTPGTSTSAPAGRTGAPTQLVLPIELVVESLQVGAIHAAALGATPLRDLHARIHLGADDGATHRIDDVSLAFDQLHARASLQLGSRAPLPLDGPAGPCAGRGAGGVPSSVRTRRCPGRSPPRR